MASDIKFANEPTFLKVEESLGLIMGYAVVCEIDGQPYFDSGEIDEETGERIQDHIPPEAMLKAAAEFMQNSRIAGTMHGRDEDDEPVKTGDVIFCWPMTKEIADSLDITVKRTGLLVAIKPDNPEDLQKAREGKYRGFSIGGYRVKDEPV